MKIFGLLQCAGAVVALAIVSACGSASPVAPSPATLHASYVGRTLFINGRPVAAQRLNPLPRYAELVPDKKSKSKDYEYIFSEYDTYASMFDYPPTTKQVGQITGAGGQGCTNVLYGYGKGIIWNPGRQNDTIVEYQVPSNKVLRTLTVPYTYTSSCSMDTSGDLAIGVLLGNSYNGGGQVIIFKQAEGSGKVYNTPLNKEYFSGYDPSGNLFADGLDANYSFQLVELPKGKSKAVTIRTSNAPCNFPAPCSGTARTYRCSISRRAKRISTKSVERPPR